LRISRHHGICCALRIGANQKLAYDLPHSLTRSVNLMSLGITVLVRTPVFSMTRTIVNMIRSYGQKQTNCRRSIQLLPTVPVAGIRCRLPFNALFGFEFVTQRGDTRRESSPIILLSVSKSSWEKFPAGTAASADGAESSSESADSSLQTPAGGGIAEPPATRTETIATSLTRRWTTSSKTVPGSRDFIRRSRHVKVSP